MNFIFTAPRSWSKCWYLLIPILFPCIVCIWLSYFHNWLVLAWTEVFILWADKFSQNCIFYAGLVWRIYTIKLVFLILAGRWLFIFWDSWITACGFWIVIILYTLLTLIHKACLTIIYWKILSKDLDEKSKLDYYLIYSHL